MASGSVGGRFRGEEGARAAWAASVERSAHLEGGEEARGGQGTPDRGGGRRGRGTGSRREVEGGPDRGTPPVSGAGRRGGS
jgi:hypothetical protein